MARRRDPRRFADRAKMRADEVARQRDAELRNKEQFKEFQGNLSMSDETPNRGVKMTRVTPEEAPYDPQKKKPLPPAEDGMLF